MPAAGPHRRRVRLDARQLEGQRRAAQLGAKRSSASLVSRRQPVADGRSAPAGGPSAGSDPNVSMLPPMFRKCFALSPMILTTYPHRNMETCKSTPSCARRRTPTHEVKVAAPETRVSMFRTLHAAVRSRNQFESSETFAKHLRNMALPGCFARPLSGRFAPLLSVSEQFGVRFRNRTTVLFRSTVKRPVSGSSAGFARVLRLVSRRASVLRSSAPVRPSCFAPVLRQFCASFSARFSLAGCFAGGWRVRFAARFALVSRSGA